MAFTTPANVCNAALALIGETQYIDDLDENTLASRTCKIIYEECRDEVLEAVDWDFARARATLALTTEERDDWAYCYSMPTDCIAPRSIVMGVTSPQLHTAFARSLNDAKDGHLILTDEVDAKLDYTARVTGVPLFTPMFRQALACRLAVDLAAALPKNFGLSNAMQVKFERQLATAIAMQRNESQSNPEPESEAIRTR